LTKIGVYTYNSARSRQLSGLVGGNMSANYAYVRRDFSTAARCLSAEK